VFANLSSVLPSNTGYLHFHEPKSISANLHCSRTKSLGWRRSNVPYVTTFNVRNQCSWMPSLCQINALTCPCCMPNTDFRKSHFKALCMVPRKDQQIFKFLNFQIQYYVAFGPGSVVVIATGYGLDGPVIESRWRGGSEISRTYPNRPCGPPSLLYNGYRVFPGGKHWPGRDADPSTLSSAVVMKEYSYTSTPLLDRTACKELQCL
jgi:hypothetical protein